MKKSPLILIIIIILLIGGIGLYFSTRQGQHEGIKKMPADVPSGVPSGKPHINLQNSGKPPMPSGTHGANIPTGEQPFMGTVSNLEGSSFSVKGPMGESKIIFTASTTFEGGSSSDLKNDVRVGGYGTKNDDGTISASQIQINPSMPEKGQIPSR